ncbi:MAG: MarR family transcriptional regulator [Clostridia bacterium]|nr:MarR family transcriptional regulator [Clostridia bacterium]
MKKEDTVGLRVRELSLAMKQAMRNRTEPCGKGAAGKPTRIHGWVIGYLYDHRGTDVYQRDIEKEFSVSKPTMTAILQRMEKNGMIERRRDANDSRLKKIILTPEALRVHELHGREIESFETAIREGISESDMEVFFAVLEKLTENAKKGAEMRQNEGKEEENGV